MSAISDSSRAALFIDGPNLHASARALGFDVDFGRLLAEFAKPGRLLRALYFTPVIEEQVYCPIRRLVDWLDYNGYTVITKAVGEFVDANGRRKMKGGIGIELVAEAMQFASHLDDIVLFSGDGDFRPLVEAVQRRGAYVTVVSTLCTRPPMIADELLRQADGFIDLADLKPCLARTGWRSSAGRDQ